jgi:hypothetical protein
MGFDLVRRSPLNSVQIPAKAGLANANNLRAATSELPNGRWAANFTLVLGDVRDVDQAVLEAVTIKHFAAGTAHH